MTLEIIKHKDILFRDIISAIEVKGVAWHYPVESHLKWIIDNIQQEDMHVFLKENSEIKSYMTLSNVVGILNSQKTNFMGVGCVCTMLPGEGMGGLLMSNINQFLVEGDYKGLLFCKKHLVDFYKKYDWQLIPNDRVFSDINTKDIFFMVYNCAEVKSLWYNDRLF